MKRKRIKNSWAEYFNFSTRERRGAIFLAGILLIQIGIIFYQKYNSRPFPVPDSKMISELLNNVSKNNQDSLISEVHVNSEKAKPELFDFDPNKTDAESWERLGLSEKQFKVINNYLSHGGKFRIKNDFKKMYCISENEYKNLEPYLLLPDSFEKKIYEKKKIEFVPLVINLAEADSNVLMNLKGIGPVLAGRIIKYRDKLGGFYTISQLKEVYGINDSLYQSLLPQLVLKNEIPFRFIHLNTDSFGVLAQHPYIKGKIAALICNYRHQHQSFSSIEEVKQLPLISEENFLKLVPYLMPD